MCVTHNFDFNLDQQILMDFLSSHRENDFDAIKRLNLIAPFHKMFTIPFHKFPSISFDLIRCVTGLVS